MNGVRAAALLMMVVSTPAVAQTSTQGVLRLPTPAERAQANAPVTPPQAAPVAPVQQVAPSGGATPAEPPKHKKPAREHKARTTPVVLAPANVHAQRPPAPAAAAAAPHAVAPILAEPEAKHDDTVGSVTGLKLPRWAALRADEVNLRVGPGTRFKIEWQYHRRDLPVMILREVEVWRLIEDQDGVKGWVHQATLVGHRSFVVKGAEAVMRGAASDTAPAVARLKPGVVGRIRACEAGSAWCEVQVDGYRGWLRRAQFWGTDPGEAVGN